MVKSENYLPLPQVMREGEELEEDTRRVESTDDMRLARAKHSGDDENELPVKPKAKKLKIIKMDTDVKVVPKPMAEEKTKAEGRVGWFELFRTV